MQDVVLYVTLHVPQFTLSLPHVPAGQLKETMKICRNLEDTLADILQTRTCKLCTHLGAGTKYIFFASAASVTGPGLRCRAVPTLYAPVLMHT